MLNELEEFQAYITFPEYTAKNKYDSTYLGRFTHDMLQHLEGLDRVLSVIARGYMFSNGNNADPDLALRALFAWCSIPDTKKASPKEDWQFKTDFRCYHGEFSELVTETGEGWFYRHIQNIVTFSKEHPEKLLSSASKACSTLEKRFPDVWRNKVKQWQISLYSDTTKGEMVLHFDDILAQALELGPLQNRDYELSEEMLAYLKSITPKDVPDYVLPVLLKYYTVNKAVDSDRVVLPVSAFDAYFGTTSFGRKWLSKIPESFMVREYSFGVSRCRIVSAFLSAT